MNATKTEIKQPAIMVVEDDRIVSTLVEHLLVRRGFGVHLAADGRAATAMLDEIEPPQLVMLDVMLPYVDGFELIARIRAKDDWSKIPIIMLTSKTQERNVVRALEAGADDYIVKPFQPQELIARVKRFIK
jgi:two-component system, OmpR family, alkaline phosphatase synthesis response regulator PhoP